MSLIRDRKVRTIGTLVLCRLELYRGPNNIVIVPNASCQASFRISARVDTW